MTRGGRRDRPNAIRPLSRSERHPIINLLRVLPHFLTLLRLFAAPVTAWLLVQARYREVLALVLLAGLTDWFDGYTARWRGIYDDHGRLMVAICHNMDLGDSWEHADNPEYPQQYSALGIRIGVNYVTYAMTH